MNSIAVVLTARASYAKYETVLEELQRVGADVTVYLCGGALLGAYGAVGDVLRARFPSLRTVDVWSHYQGGPLITAAKSAAALTSELATQFDRDKPAVVVVMADRYEVLAAAQAAAYLNIPVAHIQGGERTGSIDDKCRDAITHLATYHFPATDMAAMRIYGLTGTLAIKVGCPSIDVAARALQDPPVTQDELSGSGGEPVDPSEPFLFVLQHSDVNEWEKSREQMAETLTAVVSVYRRGNMPALIQWPNQDPGSEGVSKAIRRFMDSLGDWVSIRTMPNMPPQRFLRLMKQASVVVGNSSVGIRECSYLGTPVVNIGGRQDGRQRGPNVVDCGYSSSEIHRALLQQLSHGPYPSSRLYGDGSAGAAIANRLRDIQLSRAV